MTDDIHKKVVSIFQKHHRGELVQATSADEGEMVTTPDGFNYVTIKHQKDLGLHNEDVLQDIGEQKNYIIKFVEVHENDIRVDSYHVPGNRLTEFLTNLDKRPGKLLEVKQFLPDHLA